MSGRVLLAVMISFLGPLGKWVFGGCDWLPGDGFPGVHGPVQALAVWDDGTGSALYLGGSFRVAGDDYASHVAKWDGRRWAPLGTGMASFFSSQVYALTVYNGELIAGGRFRTAGGIECNSIARWNGTHWVPLGTGIWADYSAGHGTVYALTVYKGELIAAGAFTTAGGMSAKAIARWDGTSWSPLGVGMTGLNYQPAVFALTVYNGELIAGGNFDTAGGISANALARWDGTDWAPLGWNPRGSVGALTVYNGELVAGPGFGSTGRVSSWDGTRWAELGDAMNRSIDVLTVYGGELIAGGKFTRIGGATVNYIARWDGTDWSQLGRLGGTSEGTWETTISALAVFDGELIAGGSFDNAEGRFAADSVARWNGLQWAPLAMRFDNVVSVLTVYNDELVAAGSFRSARDVAAVGIARWDGARWDSLGSGSGLSVRALTVYKGELIAGGGFDKYITRWDGARWAPLGGGMNGEVFALITYNGELIAGGRFTSAGGVSTNYIARWDGTHWAPLGTGLSGTPSFGDGVYALTLWNAELVAGGRFSCAGDGIAYGIASWDGTRWAPLGNNVFSGGVNVLTVYNGELIIGASAYLGGAWHTIARLDGSVWAPLGVGLGATKPKDYSELFALTIYNGELIAGGWFTTAGGGSANNIARWNGTRWARLEAGVDDEVRALTVYHGELVAGGNFSFASGRVSRCWGRWGPTGIPGDADGDGRLSNSDFSELHRCISGPASADSVPVHGAVCLCSSNTDGDADIDLQDFAAFQVRFGE